MPRTRWTPSNILTPEPTGQFVVIHFHARPAVAQRLGVEPANILTIGKLKIIIVRVRVFYRRRLLRDPPVTHDHDQNIPCHGSTSEK